MKIFYDTSEFREYCLINESLSSAKKSYLFTDKIDQTIFDQLVEIDPTKTKKYIDKICKWYVEESKNAGILDELSAYITLYDTLVSRKIIKNADINKYKNFSELKQEVDNNKDVKSNTEKRKEIKDKEIEVILDRDDLFVISPLTHDAAMKYGSGTRWCITQRDGEFWHQYTYDWGVKFYFIIKRNIDEKDEEYKIAVAVYPSDKIECFNATDFPINFKVIIDKYDLNNVIFKSDAPTAFFKKAISGTYEIKEDGVHVNGNVSITGSMDKIPYKFAKVSGDFYCYNINLRTLENSPEIVGGVFDCSMNSLKTLEGAPKHCRTFICSDNFLTSLEHGPETVERKYDCSSNENLKSLKFAPKITSNENTYVNFNCNSCGLASLDYLPENIEHLMCSNNKLKNLGKSLKSLKFLYCNNNLLTSLEGLPDKMTIIECKNNKIKSLKFFANMTLSKLNISGNSLTSLTGLSNIRIYDEFDCSNNTKKFLKRDIVKKMGNQSYKCKKIIM